MSYSKEVLEECVKKDNATLVGDLPQLKKEARITFRCRCGVEDNKTFVRIKETGVLCKACTAIQRNERRAATNIVRYGTTCALQNDIIKAKAVETCLARYNTVNALRSPDIKERIKKTNLEKYGSENPFGSKVIINKIRKTCQEKYGTEHAMKNPTISNKAKETNLIRYGVEVSSKADCVKEKAKQTNLEKYGKEHHIVPEIINKIKETNLKKYGVSCSFQAKSVKEKIKGTLLERYGVSHSSNIKDIQLKKKQNCLKKFGVLHHLRCDAILRKQAATNLLRYGVPYPTQSRVVQAKSQKTGLSYKSYITPCGEVRKVQGYEPRALDILFKEQGLLESDVETDRSKVPRISYTSNNKAHYYFPDIYIYSQNKIIEVKSSWTYKLHSEVNELKWKASINAGFNCEVWVFNKKDYRIVKPGIEE